MCASQRITTTAEKERLRPRQRERGREKIIYIVKEEKKTEIEILRGIWKEVIRICTQAGEYLHM